MDFRVHNTSWMPVDFDGIKLMRRPLPQSVQPSETLKPGFSFAAKRQMAQRMQKTSVSQVKDSDPFVVIDLETTGLTPGKDQIIEFAAIRMCGQEEKGRFSCLVRCEKGIPSSIAELTGITDRLLEEKGQPPALALQGFLEFIGKDSLIGYNLAFDMEFIRSCCVQYGMASPTNRCKDLLSLARRKVYGVTNYKLSTLAEHFSLPRKQVHRAQNDCELMILLYFKLNEI